MLYYTLEKTNDGQRYYARAIQSERVSKDKIIDEIVENCATRRSVVIQVLTQLADVIHQHLLRGDKISVLDIGTFWVGIDNHSVDDPSEFDPSKHISHFHINFRPITRRDKTGHTYHPILSEIKAKPLPKV